MDWNFDLPIDRRGTDCVKYDLAESVFGKDDIIPLWVADMDFKSPQFVIDKFRQRVDHGVFGYSFRNLEYRQSIVDWMFRRHNWSINKEWLCFSPGIVPALNFSVLAYTQPGDSIIIQTPVYPPFYSAVTDHNRTLVTNSLVVRNGRWEMDFDSLARSINKKTKMLILCNPHNPVGRAWTKEELTKIGEICLEHNLLIVSDDIHCDLVLPGHKHVPIAGINPEIADITITGIAPSKTFNVAGLSTSAIIIPNPELRSRFKQFTKSLHITDGNIFGTIASTELFTKGDNWLDALIEYLGDNAKVATSFIKERIPEIKLADIEATFLMWLDCRELKMGSTELKKFFVDNAGVGLNQGTDYGPEGEGFMRLNFGTQRARLLKALEQMEKAVAILRKQ